MGMFSWIDVTGKENIEMSDNNVVLLIPQEQRGAVEQAFGVKLTDRGIEGSYDGYGRVHGIDVYDVCAFLNIICTTDEQYEQLSFRNVLTSDTKEFADTVRNHYVGNFVGKGAFKTIRDIREWFKKLEEERNSYVEFRGIGIDLGCRDEDNAALPYPIKLTVTKGYTYENSAFSMGDPEQGFYKYSMGSKRGAKILNREEDTRNKILENLMERAANQ